MTTAEIVREPTANARSRTGPGRDLAQLAVVCVSVGVIAALLYLLLLVVVLEVASLVGFLVGLEPVQILKYPIVFLVCALVLFAAVLVGLSIAWSYRLRNIGWPSWSVAQFASVLERKCWFLALLATGVVGYLLYARLVFLFGRIAGGTDEGMYLVAARSAMAGGLTYRDFPFIQGPLHPYLVGAFVAPFGFEERAARIFAIAVTLLSLLVSAAAALRLGGRLAALLAFALLVTNLDYISDLSSGVHPSGPTGGLLIALAALLFAYDRPLWSLLPLTLLVGTRVLFAPLALIGVLAAALMLRDARRPLLVAMGLVGASFAPFLVADPYAAWFDLFTQQNSRATLLPRIYDSVPPDTLANHLRSLQVATLTELTSYWPDLLGVLVVVGMLTWPSARLLFGRRRAIVLLFCVAGTVAMFLIDLLPYPFAARYPVPQLPLVAIAGGVALASLLRLRSAQATPFLAAAVSLTIVVMSPFAATREAVGNTNFVETYRSNPPLSRLEDVASFVRSVTPEDGTLITLETSIAVEAHRRLWPGLGITSWGVLNVSDDEATQVGMITANLLADAVDSRQAAAVIVSDRYTWELGHLPTRDRIQRSLAQDYTLIKEFRDVSDWGTVHIYVPVY